jgi:AAA domain-containing protein
MSFNDGLGDMFESSAPPVLPASDMLEPEDSAEITNEDDLIKAIKNWAEYGVDHDGNNRDTVPAILSGLHEILHEYPPQQPIPDARLKELIKVYAPGVPEVQQVIAPPEAKKPTTLTNLEWDFPDWRSSFKSVNQLQSGGVQMLIKGFLPEGTSLVTGYAGDGKTWLALSICKALTTGRPLFGMSEFPVTGVIPCLYLTPEQNGAAFRQRCEIMQITDDERLFLCRTCSEGSKLPLLDYKLEAAIRYLKPVVVLDTTIRFSESEDENNASQNQKLVDDILHLRNAGARAVIGVHHSRKDLKLGEPTLEAAVRGSGDLSAMTDSVWAVIRNDRLFKNGAGPNQVAVVPVKARDFTARPFDLALTRQAPKNLIGFGGPGLISCLNESHDLVHVKDAETKASALEQLELLIKDSPSITLSKLSDETGFKVYQIAEILEQAGWTKPKGRGEHVWSKK